MRRFLCGVLMVGAAGCAGGPVAPGPKAAPASAAVPAASAEAVPAPAAAAPAAPLTPPSPAPKAPAPVSALDAAAQKAAQRLKALEQRGRDEASRPALEGPDLQKRYEELLSLPGTPPERKPEILLRLAELAYRDEEAAARRVYDAGPEAEIAPGSRYPRAIAHFRRLVDQYPQAPQALTAFYNLGYLYAEEGKGALSAWAYDEVLKRDPNTVYSDEIHMRLGEAAFDGGDVAAAIPHYRAVVERGNPEYADKALYKLGWSFYNLNDFSKAVEAFSRVMDRGKASAEDLRRETLDVMGRAFLEWGGVTGISAYLAKQPQGSGYGDRLYRTVGDLYAEASRYEDAVKAYSAGVDAFPRSADCVAMERGIASALLILRDLEGLNARRESWVDRYGPGSAWEQANGSAPVGAEGKALAEEGLRLAALYHHSRAQRGEASLAKAVELYSRYQKLYGSDSEEGYELAYAYAQALKEAGRLADAQAQYGAVANHPTRTAHREEASYRRIEVLQTLYAKDPKVLDDFLAAHEAYASLNPTSALVPQVLFAEAELEFTVERFAPARGVFARVAEGSPGSPLALESLERISRCFFREGDFAGAEASARKALAARPPKETAERAWKLLAFSIFKQAEERETAGDREAANGHFFRVAKEFPDGEVAQVALSRAAENLRALGRQAEAARVYERLAHAYQGSAYARDALGVSAQILASLGDWKAAARNFEELYRAQPEGQGSAEHLFEAGKAYEKAGDHGAAARVFAEFSTRYPSDPRQVQALFREGEALQTLGRPEEAGQRFRSAWEGRAAGDEDVYRAKAVLALGDQSLEAFRKVELKGDMEEALARKEGLLDETLGFLAQAARFPFAETLTAALFRAGRALEEMKEGLLGSERPAELTPEEREQYDFLLEEKAAPLEQKAIEYYKKGIASARASGVHTPWVDKMFGRLEALIPWAYQRTEETAAAAAMADLPRPAAPAPGGRP